MSKHSLEQFLTEIGMSDEAQRALSDYANGFPDEERLKGLFYSDFSAFKAQIDARRDKYLAYLYLYCILAIDAWEEYAKRGWSREIYVDTFRDFSVWCDTCLVETGEIGLKEVEWLREPICLKIFKLGALQFQPERLEEALPLPDGSCLQEGTVIYHLHIRQGVRFTPEEIDASLAQAKRFFGVERMACFCESWFLSPKLKEALGEQSNIVRYQNRFTLLTVEEDSRSCERYIFGKFSEDFKAYTPKNRLGEYVLSLLKKGEALGEATGMFYC